MPFAAAMTRNQPSRTPLAMNAVDTDDEVAPTRPRRRLVKRRPNDDEATLRRGISLKLSSDEDAYHRPVARVGQQVNVPASSPSVEVEYTRYIHDAIKTPPKNVSIMERVSFVDLVASESSSPILPSVEDLERPMLHTDVRNEVKQKREYPVSPSKRFDVFSKRHRTYSSEPASSSPSSVEFIERRRISVESDMYSGSNKRSVLVEKAIRLKSSVDATMKDIPDAHINVIAPPAVLKPFQRQGCRWLLSLYRNRLGGILADEMGLGKTVQSIAFLASLVKFHQQRRHIVLVPASVLDNWSREISRFAPQLSVVIYAGSKEEREDLRYELSRNKSFDILLTTYPTIANNIDRSFLRKLSPNVLVMDEAHALKNRNSARYSHVLRLKARRHVLLTGTVLQNTLEELYALLSLVSVTDTNDHHSFDLSHLVDDENEDNDAASVLDAIKQIMPTFVFRRRKVQVLDDLVPKTINMEICPMSERQERIYREIETASKEWLGKEKNRGEKDFMSLLMKLRKAACHPLLLRTFFTDADVKKIARRLTQTPEFCDSPISKIEDYLQSMSDHEIHQLCLRHGRKFSAFTIPMNETSHFVDSGKIPALLRHIDLARDANEKILIFSQFVIVLDILSPVLDLYGIKHVRLDGSTPVSERIEIIDAFGSDPETHVFLLSTKAGGLGLNLVMANRVVFFDHDYNPHNDRQAEDRVHRVGQTRPVTIVKLVSKQTIEEHILKIAAKKLDLERDIEASNTDVPTKEALKELKEAFMSEQPSD